MQLDLFDTPSLKNEYVDEELIECRRCKEHKPHSEYYLYDYTRQTGSRRDCKTCYSEYQRILVTLRKIHRYPYENPICDCCGGLFHDERLQLDHDHITGAFRGFLCRSCNVGIGALGDTMEGLAQAMAYMKAHYEQQ
jgi:hypothetical protein